MVLDNSCLVNRFNAYGIGTFGDVGGNHRNFGQCPEAVIHQSWILHLAVLREMLAWEERRTRFTHINYSLMYDLKLLFSDPRQRPVTTPRFAERDWMMRA